MGLRALRSEGQSCPKISVSHGCVSSMRISFRLCSDYIKWSRSAGGPVVSGGIHEVAVVHYARRSGIAGGRMPDSPTLRRRIVGNRPVPRVSDIVNEIQCEIVQTFTKNPHLPTLEKDQYLVAVQLTLEVTNNQGVNATLNVRKPAWSVSLVFKRTFFRPFEPSFSGSQWQR